MIWPQTYEDRLRSWHDLRRFAATKEPHDSLLAINDWWWLAPMVNQSLDRDVLIWPGPWDLIGQNGFCALAKALGMSYTVLMLQRWDPDDVQLMQTADNNLVLVEQGKYILNWSPGHVVNIQSPESAIKTISGRELQRLIG